MDVTNTSDQPVYKAAVNWFRKPEETHWRGYLGVVLPDQETSNKWGQNNLLGTDSEADDNDLKAVITFRDAAGITWMRTLDGVLIEQPPEVVEPDRAIEAIRTLFGSRTPADRHDKQGDA